MSASCDSYCEFVCFVSGDVEQGIYKKLTPSHSYGLLSGGMTFNQKTGYLRISKNGTYYMYATVRFYRNANVENDIGRLAVDIKIISKCNSAHLGNKGINTGSNPKHYVIIPKGKKGGQYSMHTGGVARLCGGDYIYLKIQGMPGNIVIKNSGGASTNFGTFLIAPSCQEDASAPTTTAHPTTSTTPRSSPTTPPSDRCRKRDC